MAARKSLRKNNAMTDKEKKAASYGKPVGRPATGKNKIVVNLNLSFKTADLLTKKSLEMNKSKSIIAEEAISYYLDVDS